MILSGKTWEYLLGCDGKIQPEISCLGPSENGVYPPHGTFNMENDDRLLIDPCFSLQVSYVQTNPCSEATTCSAFV